MDRGRHCVDEALIGVRREVDGDSCSGRDRPDANRTIVDLKTMLALGHTHLDTGPWKGSSGDANAQTAPTAAETRAGTSGVESIFPAVIATSALQDQGIGELAEAIDRHRAMLERTGEIERRRAAIAERRLLAAAEGLMHEAFARHGHGKVAPLLERLRARTLSPHSAATQLLSELNFGGNA